MNVDMYISMHVASYVDVINKKYHLLNFFLWLNSPQYHIELIFNSIE